MQLSSINRSRRPTTTVRKLLWSWGNSLRFIAACEREIVELKAALALASEDAVSSGGVAKYDVLPSSSVANSPVELSFQRSQDCIARYFSLISTKRKLIADTLAFKQEVDRIYYRLSPVARDVITLRYVKCLKWDDIAVDLNYSAVRIKQIESEAVLQFAFLADKS